MSGGVTLPGAGVLSGGVMLLGVVSAGTVVLPGAVLGVVSAGAVVLPGAAPGVSAVPPGQRELSGKYSHRIFIPSGDILISVGALVDVATGLGYGGFTGFGYSNISGESQR